MTTLNKMTCCRCNQTGRCLNYCCVKNKRSCMNCLPLRLGSCYNQGHVVGVLTQTCVLPAIAVTATTAYRPQTLTNITRSASPSRQASEIPTLPEFKPMASPQFCWGELDASAFTERLNRAYSVVVHWRMNIFNIPSGNAGTDFVRELSRLFHAYAEGSAL